MHQNMKQEVTQTRYGAGGVIQRTHQPQGHARQHNSETFHPTTIPGTAPRQNQPQNLNMPPPHTPLEYIHVALKLHVPDTRDKRPLNQNKNTQQAKKKKKKRHTYHRLLLHGLLHELVNLVVCLRHDLVISLEPRHSQGLPVGLVGQQRQRCLAQPRSRLMTHAQTTNSEV